LLPLRQRAVVRAQLVEVGRQLRLDGPSFVADGRVDEGGLTRLYEARQHADKLTNCQSMMLTM
jgi:hypothetical protein